MLMSFFPSTRNHDVKVNNEKNLKIGRSLQTEFSSEIFFRDTIAVIKLLSMNLVKNAKITSKSFLGLLRRRRDRFSAKHILFPFSLRFSGIFCASTWYEHNKNRPNLLHLNSFYRRKYMRKTSR